MRISRLILGTAIISILFHHSVDAQNAITQPSVITPPSPEVSALFRNLNFAVDHASGMGQINIPIYEVKSGPLSVPISLSYNAAGRKVFDVTGPVGIGWSLSAGGAISRTIYGKPDDESTFPFQLKYSTNLTNKNDYDYLASIYYKNTNWDNDTEYDIFSYFFGGHSGKFIVDHPHSGNPQFHLLPYQPLNIVLETGGSSFSDAYPSTIHDEKGITYHFGIYERSGTSTTQLPPITCKHLTSMISPDKKDTISFSYTPVVQTKWMKLQEVIITDNDTRTTNPGTVSQTNSFPGDYKEYVIQRLTEIKFREGKVKFILDGTTDRVKTIQLLNNNNEIIRAVELDFSVSDYPLFATNNTGIYKLDSVRFKDNSNQTIEKYSFEYNPSVDFVTHDRDYWGYLNNVSGTSNITPVPSNSFIGTLLGDNGTSIGSSTTINGGKRTAATPTAGVLKKITYPTGASTEFVYEMNKFEWGMNNIFIGGGLRVEQIKTTENGITSVKTYKYGANEIGHGYLSNGSFIPSNMAYEKRYFTDLNGSQSTTASYRKRVYTSEFQPGVADAFSDPIFYPEVAEYNGTPTNNAGKTVFSYFGGSTYGIESMGGAAFSPPHVTYQHLNFMNFPSDNDLTQQHIYRYQLWKKIRLNSTVIYKNNGDNTYSEVKSTINQYKYTQTGALRGFHLNKYVECGHTDITFADPKEKEAAEFMGIGIFIFKDYELTIGKEELEKTFEMDHSENGTTLKETTYTYNDKLLPVSVKTNQSNGEVSEVVTKYPGDFINDPTLGPVSLLMKNANMISYPIEQSLLKNSVHIGSNKTIYKNWASSGPAQILVEQAQNKFRDGAYETNVRYHGYDSRSNIASVAKENDVTSSYLWGYNNTYPIAQVINAKISDVFHTSFEEGDGNSENKECITGKKSKLSGFNKTLTGLTNGTYILSYWKKNGSTWTFNKSEVTVSDQTYPIVLTGQVDEIRFHPKNSMMTTFTHEPLVGMLSQCNINNRITYFEYDRFGRLILVRDHDRNVLKKICYNYSGQVENCIDTSPDWQFTSAPQRCALDGNGGYTGNLEREQRDMNSASATYNQTRWIITGSNTVLCPPSVSVNCHSDVDQTGMMIEFLDPTTNDVRFAFQMTGFIKTLTIPEGYYNIRMYDNGPGLTHVYDVCSSYQEAVTGFYSNVLIKTSGGCTMIKLDHLAP